MPHITIEYSANLGHAAALDSLVGKMHDEALKSGVFPLGGLRTRASERKQYRIADGDPDNGFIHVVVRIGEGRDAKTKRDAAQALFDCLCHHTTALFDKNPLALSLEMQEIDAALSFKKNNMHQYVKDRADNAPRTTNK